MKLIFKSLERLKSQRNSLSQGTLGKLRGGPDDGGVDPHLRVRVLRKWLPVDISERECFVEHISQFCTRVHSHPPVAYELARIDSSSSSWLGESFFIPLSHPYLHAYTILTHSPHVFRDCSLTLVADLSSPPFSLLVSLLSVVHLLSLSHVAPSSLPSDDD